MSSSLRTRIFALAVIIMIASMLHLIVLSFIILHFAIYNLLIFSGYLISVYLEYRSRDLQPSFCFSPALLPFFLHILGLTFSSFHAVHYSSHPILISLLFRSLAL